MNNSAVERSMLEEDEVPMQRHHNFEQQQQQQYWQQTTSTLSNSVSLSSFRYSLPMEEHYPFMHYQPQTIEAIPMTEMGPSNQLVKRGSMIHPHQKEDKHSNISQNRSLGANLSPNFERRSSKRSQSNTIGAQLTTPTTPGVSSNRGGSFRGSLRRRRTMHRLVGATNSGGQVEDQFDYRPPESLLTNLYLRLPKSKRFCQFQLKLLNLDLFKSVKETLDETACGDKQMLEHNSFLFALFDQFVPHDRIPLDSLSKYVYRLHRYEILSTIEFNMLKPPCFPKAKKKEASARNQTKALSLKDNHQADSPKAARQLYSSRHAAKKENVPKNTYPNRFLPYDYNRVVLIRDAADEDNEDSEDNASGSRRSNTTTTCHSRVTPNDYINASHIDSILKPNAYIVAQGPSEHTVADFWRMVWQQNVSIILMLTKVYEFIRVMCIQYWPASVGQVDVFAARYEVTLVDEDKLADYVVRTLKVRDLKNKHHRNMVGKTGAHMIVPRDDDIERIEAAHKRYDSEEYRIIYQLHFLSWQVNACPYSDAILKFRRRAKIYEKQLIEVHGDGMGPILVHCSNGCGRSGTYVCLDSNLSLAEEESVVDVFNYARKLRKSRMSLIENLEQYKFIYETIDEYYVCGKTWFHVSDISGQLKAKSVKDKVTRKNDYQLEFEKLMQMTSKFTIGDCAGGHRLENRDKNRDVSIVPPDSFRPYLTSFQSNNQTDYINAVFVDGYSRPREYIVTEWPLKKTIPDLWSLIYDHDCNTVVVLGGVPPNNKSFPTFWPREADTPTRYGLIFTVEKISHNHPPQINSWCYRVHKKVTSLTELMAGIKAEPKMVTVFEFLAWPYDYKVPTSTNALVELIHMVERWRQRTSYGPVLVVSANGRSRVGVYCAANFALEQVEAHEEIDIFNAVKTVRRHRPALIDTVTEYKYCYDLVLHYVSYYIKKEMDKIFKKSLTQKERGRENKNEGSVAL